MTIDAQLTALANTPVTTGVLRTLDHVVPGEWSNPTSLADAIAIHLPDADDATLAAVAVRAEELFAAKPIYARAIGLFHAVDTVDRVAAAAVIARQAGRAFKVFEILDRFAPKEETTQALDAALKLTVEVVTFGMLRGIPVTSLEEAKAFPATLATYAKEDRMRIAAWIAFDGLLALGPEFMPKIIAAVQGAGDAALSEHGLFQKISEYMPGGDLQSKKAFVVGVLESASAWVNGFVAARGLTADGLTSSLTSVLTAAGAGADTLAAMVDASTNIFEHTGTQSVARVLILDAATGLEEGVELAEQAQTEESSWYAKAAAVAVGTGAGAAVGSMIFGTKAFGATAPEEAPEPEDEWTAEDAATDLGLGMMERELKQHRARLQAVPDASIEAISDPFFDEDNGVDANAWMEEDPEDDIDPDEDDWEDIDDDKDDEALSPEERQRRRQIRQRRRMARARRAEKHVASGGRRSRVADRPDPSRKEERINRKIRKLRQKRRGLRGGGRGRQPGRGRKG